MNVKHCMDCDKVLSQNNKSGFCRECFAKRKKPKLEFAQEVRNLLDSINDYREYHKTDSKRKR